MKGLIIAAPSSGAGKTTVTLGLLRHLPEQGLDVWSAKSGPDYIDSRYHEAASGRACVNLDAWAMTPDRLRGLLPERGDLLIIEGAMGLFDGAPPDGKGATADLARHLGLPVVLVVDAGRMAGSVAPLVAGFAGHDPAVRVAGVILNNVGSPRHEAMLRRALAGGPPVLGALPRRPDIALPSRHLGLMQAAERSDLQAFLDRAAGHVGAALDIDALLTLATPHTDGRPTMQRIAPLGQRIAIAADAAFSFAYPHLLDDWHSQGAELATFSPLADDPVPDCDAVFLPGGYPELHAAQLSAAHQFMQSLSAASEHIVIYGECGGYMTLGASLTDADGKTWPMAGLLDVETSFAARKLHLGYRTLHATEGPIKGHWRGHEFHYSTTLRTRGTPLFEAQDAEGNVLAPMGLRRGNVMGSYAHIIDRA